MMSLCGTMDEASSYVCLDLLRLFRTWPALRIWADAVDGCPAAPVLTIGA